MITFKTFISEGKLEDKTGFVKWNWKTDLDDEEEEGYVPAGYKKILELSMIETKEQGKGHGTELMKKFLASADAKKAELIFLDPNPGEGVNFESNKSEEEQVADLVKFYKRFGFRHNPKSATKRMWLVQKGAIPDDQLPT